MRQEFWDQRVERVRECFAAGLSKTETAQRLGINIITVRTYIRRCGLVAPSAGVDLEKISGCAARGLSRAETAAELGLSINTIGAYGRENGLLFRHARAVLSDPRSEPMAAMYKAGKTLEQIGAVYSITRERVRQILKKYHGIVGKDGGGAARASVRKQGREARRNAKFMARYGCSYEDYRSLARISKDMRADGSSYYKAPLGAYRSQEHNAKARNIEWCLSLLEWWTIWQESGKWKLRGRGQGYMMCRFGDEGPYAVGNVYIATGVHNGAVQPNNIYRVSHPRHHEIIQARVEGPPRHDIPGVRKVYFGLPVGVTFHKRSRRYQAQIGIGGVLRYLGSFKTAEEARDAYLSAIPAVRTAA